MGDPPTSPRFVLRDLPLAARLTLALFLVSVGIGYLAALVQLKFQHAAPGSVFPTEEGAINIFHGKEQTGPPISTLQRLLEADEDLSFNGTGQMSAAFTKRSEGWKSKIKTRARPLMRGGRGQPALSPEAALAAAEEALRAERDTERLAVLAWIQAGAPEEDYKKDEFCLPRELADKPLAADFVAEGKAGGEKKVKLQTILKDRCVRCHAEGGDDAKAGEYPLDTFAKLKPYVTVKEHLQDPMSLTKLAQTTHVHLLGFSMLYALTGLIFALSTYPGLLRVPIAPLPLLFQVIDISLWWLARLDSPHGEMFARGIRYTGMAVGAGLALQIVLSLFNLFGRGGKVVLLLLALGAACGGYVAKEKVVDPYLAKEKAAISAPKDTK